MQDEDALCEAVGISLKDILETKNPASLNWEIY